MGAWTVGFSFLFPSISKMRGDLVKVLPSVLAIHSFRM